MNHRNRFQKVCKDFVLNSASTSPTNCPNSNSIFKARQASKERKKSSEASQLSLLAEPPIVLSHSVPSTSTICTEIAPVPDSLALTPNRYYIWRVEDGDRWHVPIQVTLFEGWLLLDLVSGERDRDTIFRIVQGFVGSAIGGDAA